MSEEPDRDVRAAEYLLGLMEEQDRQDMASRMEQDADLRHAVLAWADRLEPLSALASPMAPSDVLWARIARSLAAAAPSAPHPDRFAGRQSSNIWRGLAAGATALAACLAAALLLSGHHLDIRVAWDPPPPIIVPKPAPRPVQTPAPPPPKDVAQQIPKAPPPVTKITKAEPPPAAPPRPPAEQAVALLSATGADHPAMKAFLTPGGNVRLVPVQKLTIAADKQLGFWIWPHGLALPIPIGRVPAEGGTLHYPYGAQDGTPVMVTLEPRGLPYTDAQGPTLFQGQMVVLNE